jgi:ketoreductase RED2
MSRSPDLQGKVVIVTGSSSGIGASIARRLSGLGARIVANSSRSAEAGEQLAADLGDCQYVQGDVGDPDTAARLVETAVDRWGQLDGLVNNAAKTIAVPLHEIENVTPEQFGDVLRVNLLGSFLMIQQALPHLRAATDGWIVNISSVAGIRQVGSSLPYAVSKAALNHMTTIVAKHAGGGVRVNAIAPGLVDTPWTESWQVQRDFVAATTPMRRIATPEDIADACVSLISNRYITGQVITVDGGLTLTT